MFRTLVDEKAAHSDAVSCLAWGRGGELVTGGLDEVAKVW